MVHTISVSHDNSVLVPIPQEYVGVKLEIIVFPFEETFESRSMHKKVTFTDFGLDAPEYKFDREEANAR
ncbi:hypothetical protein FACS189430_03070 [Bacteroidia bacterium]|nr:hypothetical protein FACS189430_03070 [Bacteroidia bacterium]